MWFGGGKLELYAATPGTGLCDNCRGGGEGPVLEPAR